MTTIVARGDRSSMPAIRAPSSARYLARIEIERRVVQCRKALDRRLATRTCRVEPLQVHPVRADRHGDECRAAVDLSELVRRDIRDRRTSASRIAQQAHLGLGIEQRRVPGRAAEAGVDVVATALPRGDGIAERHVLVDREESGAAATGPAIPTGMATRAMKAATMLARTRPFRAGSAVMGTP